MNGSLYPETKAVLARIAAALERLAPGGPAAVEIAGAAYVFEPAGLIAVETVAAVPLALLKGIDAARDTLFENTRRFADGRPANNALLWGARGTGKSSLVKAVHHTVNAARDAASQLVLIEIHREDIACLPALLRLVKASPRRFILFCDDLSFEREDAAYKSLKAALEGGIEGRPENLVFYATSNRRHLMPREMMDNERSTAINPAEAVEEKISLSDRFGLWLGFHPTSQDDYLAMVRGYVDAYALAIAEDELRARAIAWAAQRGGRSGRVAWQFIQDLAGSLDTRIGS